MILQTSVNASLSFPNIYPYQVSALKPQACIPSSWYGDLSSHSLTFISVLLRSDKTQNSGATTKTTQCNVEFISIIELDNYYQKHTY